MLVYYINHLTKYYPNQKSPANRDINLQIEAGEIFGLLGDNLRFALDMAVLCGLAFGTLWFVSRKMDWRAG